MTQKQAISLMLEDDNVFLTGPPGAGKTYVLNKFIKKVSRKGQRVAVTATTGIAATHLRGVTIHSWSGIGIKDRLDQEDKNKIISSDKFRKRYIATDVLIIDEISMLQSSRLDMVNDLAKSIRKNNKPFGGIKVIIVGDFFQLPPVNKNNQPKDFVFYSDTWRELNLKICYLTEQYRQKDNDSLLVFLNAMRNNELQESHFEIINSRLDLNKQPNQVTKLFSHNIDVDRINNKFLDLIPKSEHLYSAEVTGQTHLIEQLSKNILAPFELKLKTGAEVMFVVNNPSEGYSNGSRGRVVKFENELPVVQLLTGTKIKVSSHTWTYTEDDRVLAEVKQLPLRLAWAITIHKSQGMSLDEAEIDLRSAFTLGMGYVAISRLRSLDGLYLKGYNNVAFGLFEEVRELDQSLRFFSDAVIDKTKANSDIIQKLIDNPNIVDSRFYERLFKLRDSIAMSDESIFVLLPDTIINVLSVVKPINIDSLKLVDGIGKKTVKLYGEKIIDVIWQEFKTI